MTGADMITKARLEWTVGLFEVLERRRRESGDPNLGSGLEHELVARELRELESDILADPGALQRLLVPVRRRWRGPRGGGEQRRP
jgi:hypothetical protein